MTTIYGEGYVADMIAPTLTSDQYKARAIPRLAAIDALASRIDFTAFGWDNTNEGERWKRLMHQQALDEQAAGL